MHGQDRCKSLANVGFRRGNIVGFVVVVFVYRAHKEAEAVVGDQEIGATRRVCIRKNLGLEMVLEFEIVMLFPTR